MGGQLDGNFLPGSLPHKFILFVTLIICFVAFFSLCNAEPILQQDPPTNAAIGRSPAQRRAATSRNPTTCTLL